MLSHFDGTVEEDLSHHLGRAGHSNDDVIKLALVQAGPAAALWRAGLTAGGAPGVRGPRPQVSDLLDSGVVAPQVVEVVVVDEALGRA